MKLSNVFLSSLAVCVLAISVNGQETEPQKSETSRVSSCGCCKTGGANQTSPVILALDLDKDGEISRLEIKNAMQSLSALDSNGDGKLSRTEMHAGSRYSQVRVSTKAKVSEPQKLILGATPEYFADKLLSKFDDNKNGQLDSPEIRPQIQVMMYVIDRNRDGILTRPELVNIRSTIDNRPKLQTRNPK